MKVLLTNDDGVSSRGLAALRKYFSARRADVCVVAPLYEQSGTGHSITLYHPLRVQEVGHKEYAVEGTPADCVKIAVNELVKKPDMVISGINPGGNIGTNVIYSGTVSAAMEAFVMGIPAVAMSIDGYRNLDYSYAARLAYNLAFKLKRAGLPLCFLNVNVPNRPASKIKGVKITTQGMSRFVEIYKKRRDPHGRIYYWLDGELVDAVPDAGSDYAALRDGYVSVTPLRLNLTDTASFALAGELIQGF